MKEEKKYILLLGSNLGDRKKYLADALTQLQQKVGKIKQQTSTHTTPAWGLTNQPDFLNLVLEISTPLEPLEVLSLIQEIELQLGRQRTEKWGARTLDIDILYCGDLVMDTEQLTIPHPYLHQRKFTLDLLVELDASFIHPVLKQSNSQLQKQIDKTKP